ncbi:MAG: hypothetical protein ACK6A5_06985, partial [Flavobacteriales bacterium]
MDRERLTRLVKDPGTVDRMDLGDLRALTERYPWFSAAQLLQAKGQHASGDVLYDETLQRAAARIPSRTQLFDLVNAEAKKAAPLTIVPKVEVVPETTAPVTEAPSPEPSAPVGSNATIETLKEDPAHVPAELPELPEVALVVPEQPEKGEVISSGTEEDPLERQILEAAFASAYDLTLMAPPPPPAPREVEAPAPVVAEKAPGPEELPAHTPEPAPTPVAERPARPLRGRMRFTDWLEAEDQPTSGSVPISEPTAT